MPRQRYLVAVSVLLFNWSEESGDASGSPSPTSISVPIQLRINHYMSPMTAILELSMAGQHPCCVRAHPVCAVQALWGGEGDGGHDARLSELRGGRYSLLPSLAPRADGLYERSLALTEAHRGVGRGA